MSMQQIFHRLNSGIVDDELKELLESTTKGSLRSHELREIPLLQPCHSTMSAMMLVSCSQQLNKTVYSQERFAALMI